MLSVQLVDYHHHHYHLFNYRDYRFFISKYYIVDCCIQFTLIIAIIISSCHLIPEDELRFWVGPTYNSFLLDATWLQKLPFSFTLPFLPIAKPLFLCLKENTNLIVLHVTSLSKTCLCSSSLLCSTTSGFCFSDFVKPPLVMVYSRVLVPFKPEMQYVLSMPFSHFSQVLVWD